MSTKIPILLYCANVELLSEMSYVLRVHSYDVVAVSDSGAAVCASLNNNFACGMLVHAAQGDLAGRLIHRILNRDADIPLLFIDLVGDLAPVRYADIVLYGRNTKTINILTALQMLCGNKPRRVA